MSGMRVATAGEEALHFCRWWPIGGFCTILLRNSDKLRSVRHSLILAIAKIGEQSEFLGQIDQFSGSP